MESIFGYFDSPEQTEPAYDPGLPIECPYCLGIVDHGQAMKTISLVIQDVELRERSYFYRCHKYCYESASNNRITEIESIVIDGIHTIKTPRMDVN